MILFFFSPPCSAPAAFLYNKDYVIRQDQGQDILCDPYIVQKNDWVIKLFQRRGQIAEQDFPEFLRIFQRLNPHVNDVDKILPGQDILIPLKKLEHETLPGQSSGVVTIPFVSISKLPDFIQKDSAEYTVKPGDYISSIISTGYGRYGSKSYREGVELFKLINPELTDINRIYPGQTIHVPNPGLQDKPWYAKLFNKDGQINTKMDINSLISPRDKPKTDVLTGKTPVAASGLSSAQPVSPEKKQLSTGATEQVPVRQTVSSLSEAATALGAKLLSKGTYYFPRPGQKDFKLDLTRYPVIQLSDGSRVLFCENDDLPLSDKKALMSFWKDLRIMRLPLQSTFEQVLDAIFRSDDRYELKNRLHLEDHGVAIDIKAKWIIRSKPSDMEGNTSVTCIFYKNETDFPLPVSLASYLSQSGVMIREIPKYGAAPVSSEGSPAPQPLKASQSALISLQNDLETTVSDLLTAMGCHYSQKVNISFPYAGTQINALSNLISTSKGRQLLVDYGDLYGDALISIRKTGLQIVELAGIKDWKIAARHIFSELRFSFADNLDFKALTRPDDGHITIHLPGVVVETDARESFLITPASLRQELAQLLIQSGYCPIMVSGNGDGEDSPAPGMQP